MITLPIYNTEGKEIDNVKLDEKVFDGLVHKTALHQAVVAFRANQRKGLASTKTRGEVSGGGRKPWRQKGTGRARVGSTRSPLWRHGGVVFGPHPRDYSRLLPKRIKQLALKSALNAKLKENNLIIIDALKAQEGKTREVARIFSNLKVGAQTKKALLVVGGTLDEQLARALRNLSFLEVGNARYTNAYELLAARKVIATKDGFKELISRIK
ncbi:MAG: 50S ribosomal protein L4 [Candidatus Omnitrophota bacterium]|jgi:large subunit ribosomal protein L4|nr:MAG: 50S ribosomal protein L4 [Candidatus Omnitrophota bacterium]